MPYILSERKGKYCMTNKNTGKSYCYDSAGAREKGMKMHEAFSHGFKLIGKVKAPKHLRGKKF